MGSIITTKVVVYDNAREMLSFTQNWLVLHRKDHERICTTNEQKGMDQIKYAI